MNDLESNASHVPADRRTFLAGSSLGATTVASNQVLASHAAEVSSTKDAQAVSGLITREREPLNLEYPFTTLREVNTPNNQFFVRTHFPIPTLKPDSWRLKCFGHTERELTFNLDEIRKLPSKTVAATIECAGNSRVYLVPKAKGVLWELGGVSTAEWTGVPLSAVLDKVGVKDGALEVILQGADKGELKEEPTTPGEIHFARSISIEKARRPEVLLAYQMNGMDLSVEHGFPLRAIVPGWYGMASVKWLTSVEVTTETFDGYWQTSEYAYWTRYSGEPVSVPVRELQVKSEIARPARGESVSGGKPYRVFGAAWSEAEISKVEVSVDSGKSWQAAQLLGEPVPFTWRLWEFDWLPTKGAGKVTVMSRATDKAGHQQPSAHVPDKKAYLVNHTLPVEVGVT